MVHGPGHTTHSPTSVCFLLLCALHASGTTQQCTDRATTSCLERGVCCCCASASHLTLLTMWQPSTLPRPVSARNKRNTMPVWQIHAVLPVSSRFRRNRMRPAARHMHLSAVRVVSLLRHNQEIPDNNSGAQSMLRPVGLTDTTLPPSSNSRQQHAYACGKSVLYPDELLCWILRFPTFYSCREW